MNTSFERYVNCFLHPRDAQQPLKKSDEVLYLPIKGRENEGYSLRLEESLAVSWLLAVFQAFYTVIIMFLGY